MNVSASALPSPKTVNNALSAYMSSMELNIPFLEIVERGHQLSETHKLNAPVHPDSVARWN